MINTFFYVDEHISVVLWVHNLKSELVAFPNQMVHVDWALADNEPFDPRFIYQILFHMKFS